MSNDPAIHVARQGRVARALAAVGRAPRGQRHPAWLGSAVQLSELRRVAGDSALRVERVWGEGSQYCQVLLRREASAAGIERRSGPRLS